MAAAFLLASFVSIVHAQNLNVVNGQIFGSGLTIVNSPQPDTPMGGDTLEVSLDVTGNGRVDQPPYAPNVDTGLLEVTIFLHSYTTGLNLTITNATRQGWEDDTDEDEAWRCDPDEDSDRPVAGCQDILLQESGSTVKHVDYVWPDCLVGDGGAGNDCTDEDDLENCLEGDARGPYNISIHERFRFKGEDFYTITDLPIQVTNSIPERSSSGDGNEDTERPLCSLRNNILQTPEEQAASVNGMDRPLGGQQDNDNQGNDGQDNQSNGAQGFQGNFGQGNPGDQADSGSQGDEDGNDRNGGGFGSDVRGGNRNGGDGPGGDRDGENGGDRDDGRDRGDGDVGDGDGGNSPSWVSFWETDNGERPNNNPPQEDGADNNDSDQMNPFNDPDDSNFDPFHDGRPMTPTCTIIDSTPVLCTAAPQTGIGLTNLIPNAASEVRGSLALMYIGYTLVSVHLLVGLFWS